jgi:hypothetical protein
MQTELRRWSEYDHITIIAKTKDTGTRYIRNEEINTRHEILAQIYSDLCEAVCSSESLLPSAFLLLFPK